VTRGLTILSEDFLAGRRLLAATLTVEMRVADFTTAAGYGFGVTGELSATADYNGPHAWANALQAAGFHGIGYHVRQDRRGDLAGIAWFGRAGRARRPPVGHSRHLPADLLLAASPFGVQISGDLPPSRPDTG
jgi:hypothetical protein